MRLTLAHMSKLSNTEKNSLLGLKLTRIRLKSGLTQAEFAERLDLSSRAYGNYERGEREIPTILFEALLRVFNIDPLWILDGKDDEPRLAGRRELDYDLLEGIIALIEEWLLKHRRALPPEKKAKVIRLAYQHCIAFGSVDAPHVRDMLTLAA